MFRQGERPAVMSRRNCVEGPPASSQAELNIMQSSSAIDAGAGMHTIPDHVPRELVRSFDFRTGLGPYPHESVAALHS
jgi:hypothetical protein